MAAEADFGVHAGQEFAIGVVDVDLHQHGAGGGVEVLEDPEKSRKLILATNQADVRVLVVRATDVPTYVQYGGADLGITGKDTLLEHGSEGLYQPLDLQIAK